MLKGAAIKIEIMIPISGIQLKSIETLLSKRTIKVKPARYDQ
ncbi:hypothetical protein EUBDOL_02304 [Amedibacillus dolichus DSM 3991]|uniref:Uncharacterized protein n=1 Tax=Amedibacillus dolichus DSM 3991 TaxID=428127 RepID=A8RFP3_9FIRM|nr:hypothetical protein EUBDOL_02304 [Amedibacillus dolichus DSM 3991]